MPFNLTTKMRWNRTKIALKKSVRLTDKQWQQLQEHLLPTKF